MMRSFPVSAEGRWFFQSLRFLPRAVVLQIAVTCLLGLEKPAVGLAKQGELADLKQAYEESIATGRDMVTKCIELRIRFFHNGYEESGEWGEKWDEATKELAAHSKKIRKAAIDYFLAHEEPDPELRKVVGLSIKSMLQDKEFQLAHKVLVRFEKIAPKDLSIQTELALLSTRLNDFERGIKFMQKPEAQTAIEMVESRLDKALLFSSSELQKKWKRELELRKKDAAANLPRVKLELPAGEVTIELFEDEAPIAVANFLHLIETGFYDETKFHRVIDNQMAHGGVFRSAPGQRIDYTIADEMTRPDARHHFRGVVSMFNYAHKDSAHAEFFILTSPLAHLDWDGTDEDAFRYTVFGRVVEGMEAVDRLQATHRFDKEEQKEVEIEGVTSWDTLRRAKVIRKKDHQYQFERIEKR